MTVARESFGSRLLAVCYVLVLFIGSVTTARAGAAQCVGGAAGCSPAFGRALPTLAASVVSVGPITYDSATGRVLFAITNSGERPLTAWEWRLIVDRPDGTQDVTVYAEEYFRTGHSTASDVKGIDGLGALEHHDGAIQPGQYHECVLTLAPGSGATRVRVEPLGVMFLRGTYLGDPDWASRLTVERRVEVDDLRALLADLETLLHSTDLPRDLVALEKRQRSHELAMQAAGPHLRDSVLRAASRTESERVSVCRQLGRHASDAGFTDALRKVIAVLQDRLGFEVAQIGGQ